MKPCGNPKCCTSTGICETTTHGYGLLCRNGYWQNPCFVCARHYEKVFKELQWPFPKTNPDPLASEIETRNCFRCKKPFDCFKDDPACINHCDECEDLSLPHWDILEEFV